jgi:hypothetical protein
LPLTTSCDQLPPSTGAGTVGTGILVEPPGPGFHIISTVTSSYGTALRQVMWSLHGGAVEARFPVRHHVFRPEIP